MLTMDAGDRSDARVALGMAVGARAQETVERTWVRARRVGVSPPSAAYDEHQRQSTFIGTLLIARWLVTGVAADEDDHAWLLRGSRLAVTEAVPMAHTVRGFFAWRDVLVEVVHEEADRLGTPPDVRELAAAVVQRSCDASLARMAADQDRHRTEVSGELLSSEARFRGLYHAMGCGVVIVGGDGRVLEYNDAAISILGVPPERIRARNLFEAQPAIRDESGREVMPLAYEAFQKRAPIRGRVTEIRIQGRSHWLQADAVPSLDGDGQVREIVVTYIDVTAVREAERARAESEAKSRFLAVMSHELRTPLNSILGFAQLLRLHREGSLNDRERRYLDNIEESGRHLLTLINDVLDLSRVAAGALRVECAEICVADVLEEVERELQPQVRFKGLELDVNVAPGLVVAADPLRIRQVVTNLVSNAIKFTEAGRVSIRARAAGDRVEIEVADTGTGIPPEFIERVFDDFTQVDSGFTRNHEGSGLGLPLARRLTEQMGGTLVIESEPGRGTRATVNMPARLLPSAGRAPEVSRAV